MQTLRDSQSPSSPQPPSEQTGGEEIANPMPTGGVEQERPSPMASSPQPSPFPTETVVVPSSPEVGQGWQAGGQTEDTAGPAAFTPVAVPATHAPPKAGRSWTRTIRMIGILAVVGTLLFVGARFAVRLLGGGGQVNLLYWGLWENDAVIRDVISDFETSHPTIKVQYVKQSPKQYRERLQAALARNEGPDVFRFHNTWVPMLYRDLALVPKTVMTPDQFFSTFYPVAGSDLVAGTSIYGIPLMIDGLGLYYNEDLLATAGVSVPTTWNEVLEVVPKLTVKNDQAIVTSAIALGTTGNVEHMSDIVATMMLQNGAKLTNLQSKEAEEALIFYRKFADRADPVYTWNAGMDNSVVAFANGRVAMILAPSWRAFDVRQINPALRFKIAPIPQLPGNIVTWASYWVEGVSAKTKFSKEAWEFVKYLTSKDVAMKLYTEASKVRLFGEPYARTELGKSLELDPFVGAYITQAKTAKSFPLASRTFDNGINDKLIKYLEDAVNAVAAGSAPATALATAQAGFTQVLSSYGISAATVTP